MASRQPARDDTGMFAGMEAVVLGLLVFVVGTLLVANAWAVVDAKLAVEATAREATRAFVEAPAADQAWPSAERAAADTIEGHRRDARLLILHAPDAELRRCASVTFHASYPVTILRLPLLGRAAGQLTVTGRHSERVDAHRSGLPGVSPC